MTKEDISVFSIRIAQGSKTELVVITYEIIINYLETAKVEFQDENKDEFLFNIKKAMEFIDDLTTNLDMNYSVSYELINLYMYSKKCLINASARISDNKLDSVINVMKDLRGAFENVSKQDISNERLMDTSEQIYTGFTYGKNSKLNEYVIRNV